MSKGQVYGILGPNGSGKTTTLAIAMGIIKSQRGKCVWFCQNTPADNSWKKNVGTLIEVPYFYPYLDLVDNLKIVAEIKQVPFGDIFRVLQVAGLYERRHSTYRTLSLGMQQRMAIASVMLGDPDVLVLDEPTNGLDPQGIADVREIILSEREKGKTIILASHILAEVERVCTHVAVLKNGRLLADGPVAQLLGRDETLVIGAKDNEKLMKALSMSEMINTSDFREDGIWISLKEGFTPEQLNRYLMEQGIALSKLEKKKKTLESQFLELVK